MRKKNNLKFLSYSKDNLKLFFYYIGALLKLLQSTILKFFLSPREEECEIMKCSINVLRGSRLVSLCTKTKRDCYATSYNWDHLKARSLDKCYVNGNEYEIGENLEAKDLRRTLTTSIALANADELTKEYK